MRASAVLLAFLATIVTGYLYWEVGGTGAGISIMLLLTGIFMLTGSSFRTAWAATILYTIPYAIAASTILTTAFPSVLPVTQALVKATGSPGRIFPLALVVLIGLGITAEHEDTIHRAGWENFVFTVYSLLVAFAGISIGWLVLLGTERTGVTTSPLLIPFLILIASIVTALRGEGGYKKVVLAAEVHPEPGSLIVECEGERWEIPVPGWGYRPTRIEIELEKAPGRVLIKRKGETRGLKPVAKGIDGGTLFLLFLEED